MTSKKTVLTLALGAAIAAALAIAPVSAADNPFATQSLGKGYMVAEADKAPVAKCGGMKGMKGMKDMDGKVSKEEFMKSHEAMFDKADANKDGFIDSAEMAKMKSMNGKCGGMKGKGMEGKCGGKMSTEDADANTKMRKEGKCGEGKCGAKNLKEGKCGEKPKAMEGK